MNPSRLRSERTHPFVFPPRSSLEGERDGRFFQAEGGELCATLDSRWEALLGALGGLGPVAIILHNPHLRIASITRRLDFQPEPESGTFVELSSGLMVDPGDWAYALAVEERVPGGVIFGFQFFDHRGRGQLKLLLTRQARPAAFFDLLKAHVAGGFPPEVERADAVAEPVVPTPTPPGRRLLRRLWRVTRHETGGWFFPGLPGVSRLSVLRHVGQVYARPVAFESLIPLLLEARRAELPLRVTLFSHGAAHAICCLPRYVERCPEGLHLFDAESEFHLFSGEETLYWIISKGGHAAVEIISTTGQRLGLIESMRLPLWQKEWDRILANG